MSELAFNANGDHFEIPAGVTGWRVRRMKPRGAPELVYGKDGKPLVMPIEADMDELRDAVGQLGRYRLDPVNDDGKVLDSVPAAYIQVVKTERTHERAEPAPAIDERDGVIKEAMRLNTELAKSVIDKFPEMMTAAAELLRAADGAGIPARAPRAIDVEEEDENAAEVVVPPAFDLNALVAQVVPMLVTAFMKGNLKAPELGAVLDWRKAAKPAIEKRTTKAIERPADAPAHAPDNATDVIPPIDAETMAHFIAIQSALKPEEATLAREVAGNLSAAELHAWFDELKKLTVPQAVQKIRTLVAGNTEAVP